MNMKSVKALKILALIGICANIPFTIMELIAKNPWGIGAGVVLSGISIYMFLDARKSEKLLTFNQKMVDFFSMNPEEQKVKKIPQIYVMVPKEVNSITYSGRPLHFRVNIQDEMTFCGRKPSPSVRELVISNIETILKNFESLDQFLENELATNEDLIVEFEGERVTLCKQCLSRINKELSLIEKKV